MSKTNCGCPYCKGEKIPQSRNAWKSRRNKHGRLFGVHPKGHKAKQKRVNIVQFT